MSGARPGIRPIFLICSHSSKALIDKKGLSLHLQAHWQAKRPDDERFEQSRSLSTRRCGRGWPNSHGRAALEQDPKTEPIAVELDPGSALLFLGSTLHGAGGNRTDAVRRGMIISYCLGWLKPYENQWLAYPPEVAKHFPPEVAALVGYRQHRPNLGNYEGNCPSILLTGETPGGATDALRPDQQILVEDYVARQRTGS